MIIKKLFPKWINFLEKLDNSFVKYLAFYNYKNYVKQIKLRKNEKVLEVGCGIGNLSRFLIQELPFGNLICIDVSKYSINKNKRSLKKFKNIEFLVEDILRFKRENYFNVAVVHYVLHDLPQKEKVIEVLRNCLKENGRVYLREPTRKNHGISSKEIRKLMKGGGFLKIKSREGYSFPLKGKIFEGVFMKFT